MTIRAGLIGYGMAGRVFHAPLLQASGFEIAWVASSRSEELARDLPQAKVIVDPMAAAACNDVDLVVIASPNPTHFSLAKVALDAGHAVVVDKPFTITVAEAEELTVLAQARKCLLSVFHNRRWDSDFLALKSSIAHGDLGAVVSYQCRYDRFRPVVQDRWRERAVAGVGLFFDLGPHLVDQALQLFGWPEWLMADLSMQREGSQVNDGFHLLMGKGRLRIFLAASSLAVEPEPKFVVHGTHGSFIKEGIDMQEEHLKAGLRPGDAGFGIEPSSQDATVTTMRNGQVETKRIPALPGDYVAYYIGIREAIKNGMPVPVSAKEAVDTMRILELASRSHRDGIRMLL